MLCINGFVLTSSTNECKAFFKFIFEFLAETEQNFKQIARREYWSKCNVLYINDFSQQALQTYRRLF